MLIVDPVKRATITEIRQMPFFQEGLPRYLQPLPEVDRFPTLPMDDLSTLLLINEGQADPKKVAESKGLVFTEDLGVIDPDIVEEVLEKISTYSPEIVWGALQEQGDNQVKVAYQLVRDHRRIIKDCKCTRIRILPRECADLVALNANALEEDDEITAMEDFMASSPPAWNSQMPRPPDHVQPPSNGQEELDIEDFDGDIQDIPNAHFDVLDSSLPGYSGRAGKSGGTTEDVSRAKAQNRPHLAPPP
jgi:carbon catabolite-derepressing protein kinase